MNEWNNVEWRNRDWEGYKFPDSDRVVLCCLKGTSQGMTGSKISKMSYYKNKWWHVNDWTGETTEPKNSWYAVEFWMEMPEYPIRDKYPKRWVNGKPPKENKND